MEKWWWWCTVFYCSHYRPTVCTLNLNCIQKTLALCCCCAVIHQRLIVSTKWTVVLIDIPRKPDGKTIMCFCMHVNTIRFSLQQVDYTIFMKCFIVFCCIYFNIWAFLMHYTYNSICSKTLYIQNINTVEIKLYCMINRTSRTTWYT